MNVAVGSHRPPPGGPDIPGALGFLLDTMKRGLDPWTTHKRYETLHPFMDGNGRSGRALWLWQMIHQYGGRDPYALRRGFLHTFYYQTLSEGRP
jgi:Fic/DOC family protein